MLAASLSRNPAPALALRGAMGRTGLRPTALGNALGNSIADEMKPRDELGDFINQKVAEQNRWDLARRWEMAPTDYGLTAGGAVRLGGGSSAEVDAPAAFSGAGYVKALQGVGLPVSDGLASQEGTSAGGPRPIPDIVPEKVGRRMPSTEPAAWTGGAGGGRGFLNPAPASMYGSYPFTGRSTVNDPAAYVDPRVRIPQLIDMSNASDSAGRSAAEWKAAAAEYKQLTRTPGVRWTSDSIYNGLWSKGVQASILPGGTGVGNDDLNQVVRIGIESNTHAEIGVSAAGAGAAIKGIAGVGRGANQADASNSTGPVVFRAPPNATAEEIAQVRQYVEGSNEALKAGYLSPTGRVSTGGDLRTDASLAAAQERTRAAAAGTPYQGHAGHVPDTTWTANPQPYFWLDLAPRVNHSLGGQAKGYPVGYQPTEFIFKP